MFVKAAGVNAVGSFSTWAAAGIPVAGSYDTTLNGVTLTAPVVGQIHFEAIAGGLTAYLYRMTANALVAQSVILCDRLWHNGGIDITSTASQAITSPTWPARDRNGATNGEDVYIDAEVSATTGGGTPTLSLSYTNSAGSSGKTGVNIDATTASSIARKVYPIRVEGTDRGVGSVQALQLSSSWTSGTINLVARRQLATLTVGSGNVRAVADVITGLMVKMHPDSVPYIIFRSTAASGTASALVSTLQLTHG
jgi:hypothetical protein